MGLIAKLGGWLAPPALAETERHAIEHAIDRVDPRLRLLSGYERKLAPAVRGALAYCDDLVAAIPGPIDINVRAFGTDPLVHAVFAAPADIGRMLALSREVRDFVADPANMAAEELFAVVGMRHKEKTVLGFEAHGEIIQEGVPRRLLYFADHTLRELSGDLGTTRRRLRAAAFDSLVKSFAAQLEELRRRRLDLRSDWEQERALVRGDAPDDVGTHVRRRLELEQGLRAATQSLEPAHVLEALIGWFAAPESRLHLEETRVVVDRLGVIADAARNDAAGQMLSLPELVGRDRRRWVVLLTRISRADAVRAQQESAHANRYLVI